MDKEILGKVGKRDSIPSYIFNILILPNAPSQSQGCCCSGDP